MNKMKLISCKRILFECRYLIIIAAAILLFFLKDTIIQARGPIPVTEFSPDHLNNKYVTMTINQAYGEFDKKTLSNERIGFAYVVKPDGMDACFAAYFPQDNTQSIAALSKELLNKETGSERNIEITGVLKKMSGNQKEKYNKYIASLASENGIQLESLNFIFTPTTSPFGTLSGMLRWCYIGGTILGVIILLALFSFTGIYQMPAKRLLNGCSVSEKQEILTQIKNGKRFSGDVIIGTEYSIVYIGPITFLLKNSDIHSIYLQKARFNFTNKNKKQYDLYIQRKDLSKLKVKTYASGKIADRFKELCPGISMEYSTEDSDSYYME